MLLREALDLRRGEMAALIGAGGKTTTMFHLAKELREGGCKILLTTTTKIFKPNKPHVDRLFLVDRIDALAEACAEIPAPVIISAGSAVSDDGKLVGLPAAWLDRLNHEKKFDAILVEADGAASRWFKVPGEHEPVVPQSCQLTIWLMAITVLNQPLDADSIHRPDRALQLLQRGAGEKMSEDLIIELVKNPAGCWKGIPAGSRKAVVINQVDRPEQVAEARSLAQKLLACGGERIVITSFTADQPVKEVLLQ